MADYPLGSLGMQIREHWKKYRPQMYAELEQSGDPGGEPVSRPKERTSDLMGSLLDKGTAASPGVGDSEGGVGIPPQRGG